MGETHFQIGQKGEALCHFFCFNLCYLQGCCCFPSTTLSEQGVLTHRLSTVHVTLTVCLSQHLGCLSTRGSEAPLPCSYQGYLGRPMYLSWPSAYPAALTVCLNQHLINSLPVQAHSPSACTSTVYQHSYTNCVPKNSTLTAYLLRHIDCLPTQTPCLSAYSGILAVNLPKHLNHIPNKTHLPTQYLGHLPSQTPIFRHVSPENFYRDKGILSLVASIGL